MNPKYTLIACFIITLISCETKTIEKIAKSDKGIIADMLPPNIRALYNVSAGDSAAYHQHAKNMYLNYMQQNEKDSALFCLIAWHEVLDQNYIYDSLALYWAIEHLKNGLGSKQNQQELLKLGYYIGSMYYTTDNPDSCIYWFYYTLGQSNALERTKVRCRTVLANILGNYNKMDSAIILTQLNVEYYRNINDTVNLSISMANLGSMYRYIYAFELTDKITEEALSFANLQKDTFSMIMIRHANVLNLLEFEERENELKQNVYEINELMLNYTKVNLNLEFTQALTNIDYYQRTNNIDSLDYWIPKFKTICEIRGGESLYDYNFHKIRYEFLKGEKVLNRKWLIEEALSSKKNNAYKRAYTCYYMLLKDAVKNNDYKNALEYSRTLNEINEKLFEATNKGKLYELELRFETKFKDQQLKIKSFELQNKQQKVIWLTMALISLTLVFFIYILWQKQKSLQLKKWQEDRFTKQLMTETEAERKRIAQDLHDSVGHDLLNLKNQINNKLQLNEMAVDNIINEVREISRNLFPVMFEEVGLSTSLNQLADKFTKTNGLNIVTDINYTKNTLSTEKELLLFRIIQEALSNTLKYANALSANIAIHTEAQNLMVTIQDNGTGFNVDEVLQKGEAFGIFSIKKRAELMHARAEILSNTNGTVIKLTIPINKN